MKLSTFICLGALIVPLANAVSNANPLENDATLQYSTRSTPFLPFGPNPISSFDLATSFPPPLIQDASAIESIKNTLALYVFAVDGKNFAALTEVFTVDVFADYSTTLGSFTALNPLISALDAVLTCVTTQHSYSTQLVQIVSLTSAYSVTYVTAVHFGKRLLTNEVATAFARYQDTWQRQPNGRWKILQRYLEYTVCSLSNCPQQVRKLTKI